MTQVFTPYLMPSLAAAFAPILEGFKPQTLLKLELEAPERVRKAPMVQVTSFAATLECPERVSSPNLVQLHSKGA